MYHFWIYRVGSISKVISLSEKGCLLRTTLILRIHMRFSSVISKDYLTIFILFKHLFVPDDQRQKMNHKIHPCHWLGRSYQLFQCFWTTWTRMKITAFFVLQLVCNSLPYKLLTHRKIHLLFFEQKNNYRILKMIRTEIIQGNIHQPPIYTSSLDEALTFHDDGQVSIIYQSRWKC